MGFFDSSSSSTTSNLTQSISKDLTVASGAQGFQADNGATQTVNLLDAGAISGAFDLIKANDAYSNRNYESLLKTTGAALSDIVGASNSSLSNLLSGVASTQNFIASTQATAKGALDSKTITLIAGAVAVVLGLYFLKGRA